MTSLQAKGTGMKTVGCGILLLAFGLIGLGYPAPAGSPKPLPAFPKKVAVPLGGLQNVFQVGERMYSGSEPHGEEGFRTLAKMGVKVIVSVDGARPDLELAKKYGLRYVHLPIGYDGIHEPAGAALANLTRALSGPFYIHCHHGKHRGPAAAAVACLAAGADGDTALEILKQAGTGKEYAGLWRDVKNYRPPAAGAKLPLLVEEAKVESLAAAMAKLDRQFDHLVLCQQAGWKTPGDHPDLEPVQEALLLFEGFREAGRNLDKDRDNTFRVWLAEAEESARALQTSMKSGRPAEAARHMDAVKNACSRCHAKYRN